MFVCSHSNVNSHDENGNDKKILDDIKKIKKQFRRDKNKKHIPQYWINEKVIE
jgi:hypothetical protein